MSFSSLVHLCIAQKTKGTDLYVFSYPCLGEVCVPGASDVHGVGPVTRLEHHPRRVSTGRVKRQRTLPIGALHTRRAKELHFRYY